MPETAARTWFTALERRVVSDGRSLVMSRCYEAYSRVCGKHVNVLSSFRIPYPRNEVRLLAGRFKFDDSLRAFARFEYNWQRMVTELIRFIEFRIGETPWGEDYSLMRPIFMFQPNDVSRGQLDSPSVRLRMAILQWVFCRAILYRAVCCERHGMSRVCCFAGAQFKAVERRQEWQSTR